MTQSPIVLIPGFMCDASLWQFMQDGLAELGPLQFASLSLSASIEQMAQDLLPDLPDNCSLIGFSMGGYVARRLAWLAPHKVRRLVLLNSSARATSAAEIARNQQQIRMLQVIPYRGQTRSALQMAIWPEHPDNEALLEQLQAMSLRLGREVFLAQMAIVRSDGHAELAALECPGLIVASRADRLRSLAEAQAMADAYPGSRLVILEQCGHMSVLEQPQQVLAQLRQFWQNT